MKGKDLKKWIKETAKDLDSKGYIVIPTRKKDGETKPSVGFANRKKSLEFDAPEWKKADMISIVLNGLLLVDWDKNHAEDGEEVISCEELAKKADFPDYMDPVQKNEAGTSTHWLFSFPNFKPNKFVQSNHGTWIPRVDLKTHNQLMHVKPTKENALPAVSELFVIPKKLKKVLKRTDNHKKNIEGGKSGSNNYGVRTTPPDIRDIKKSIAGIDPSCSGDAWRGIIFGLSYNFSYNNEGLEIARQWSRGDLWSGSKKKWPNGKPWGYSGDGWTEEIYFRNEGRPIQGKPKTILTLFQYSTGKEEAGLCDAAPVKKIKKKDRAKFKDIKKVADSNKTITFPPLDTSYMPKMVRMVHEEFLKQSVEPVPQFVYMAAETVLQYMAGNIPVNPMRGRTTAVPMIGAAESGSGKDTNTKDIINRFVKELLKVCPEGKEELLKPLYGGSASQTSATSLIESMNGGKEGKGEKLRAWINTEASTVIKVLSSEDTSGHGSSSLTTTLNQIYDGQHLQGLSRAGKQIKGVEKPHLPICWLIQIGVIKENFTQSLLSVGALGRFEYYIDLSAYEVKNTYEKHVTLPPFCEGFLKKILKFMVKNHGSEDGQFVENEQIMMQFESDETARHFGSWKTENLSKKKYKLDDGLRAIVARIEMSMEKRLSYYAFFGSKVITKAMVDGVRPYMDYQLKVKEQIYLKEVRGDSVDEKIVQIISDVLADPKKRTDVKNGLVQYTTIYRMFMNRVRGNSKYQHWNSTKLKAILDEFVNEHKWPFDESGKGKYYGLPKLHFLKRGLN